MLSKKTFDWLKYKDFLYLDFYLPKYKIAIECQGEQHFKPISYWGGKEKLQLILQRDKIKKKLCQEHNIKILYYSNLKIKYPYNVFENINDLLNEIINVK